MPRALAISGTLDIWRGGWLSVRQPWAWAVIHASKDIENRLWQPWRLDHDPDQDGQVIEIIDVGSYFAGKTKSLRAAGRP
jgi:hypothetical protein